MKEPCRDPGVDGSAKVSLVRHRVALAECENKRALAVTSYEDVRITLGVKP